MNIELVHIGFGNILAMNRVIAIASPNSAPIKRAIQALKETNNIAKGEGTEKGTRHLIDMTSGRKTKAVIFTDSGDIILAALAPETISGRLINNRGIMPGHEDDKDEPERSILVES